jgi:carbamoyltransferase
MFTTETGDDWMAKVIGIGGSIHDFAACMIDEQRNIYAIEDERLNRIRYALGTTNPCEPSLRYILDWAGSSIEEIREIAGNDMLTPFINAKNFPPLTLYNHHVTHAYSTFFTSPFDEAAILVLDGAGSLVSAPGEWVERETLSYSMGRLNEISLIGRVTGQATHVVHPKGYPPPIHNSLGHLYRAITETVGFGWMNAGKTMGLAPYGDNRYVEDLMRFVRLLPNGQYEIRIADDGGMYDRLSELRADGLTRTTNPFEVDAALAYAGQAVLEAVVFHALDYLWSKTKTPNLCLAGGVALNGITNGLIAARTPFKNIHVYFAPGDDGTAVGAAMVSYLNGKEHEPAPIRFQSNPFLGRSYSPDDNRAAIDASGVSYTCPQDMHQEVAQLIAQGKTVAWFEGGSEFGPRALGHRSIFADPRSPTMLDHINKNIKAREWFRPLAPAVIAEEANTYFDMQVFSPYMNFVWQVREAYQQVLPAITHIDKSSRIQAVKQPGNESLYRLLEAFKGITGIPVLINTSFNTKGDPIVETPTEAVQTWIDSELDALVLGEFLIQRKP